MLVPDPAAEAGRATGNRPCPASAQRSCEHLHRAKPLPKPKMASCASRCKLRRKQERCPSCSGDEEPVGCTALPGCPHLHGEEISCLTPNLDDRRSQHTQPSTKQGRDPETPQSTGLSHRLPPDQALSYETLVSKNSSARRDPGSPRAAPLTSVPASTRAGSTTHDFGTKGTANATAPSGGRDPEQSLGSHLAQVPQSTQPWVIPCCLNGGFAPLQGQPGSCSQSCSHPDQHHSRCPSSSPSSGSSPAAGLEGAWEAPAFSQELPAHGQERDLAWGLGTGGRWSELAASKGNQSSGAVSTTH